MRTADYMRLVFLATIWGGSFIFQRVASPVLGAALVAEGRLLVAGLALAFWFRLIADVGATRALTVTYLMPLFAVLWGMLFLGESLPASALAGGVLILAGTVLVTRG